jgi:uncharacterized membrane protein
MKRILLVIVLAAMSVGAQARHVAAGIGGGVGGATSGPSGSQGNGQYGSRYSPGYTLGDEYRAWPEAEMKQYAKPKFVPYDGK